MCVTPRRDLRPRSPASPRARTPPEIPGFPFLNPAAPPAPPSHPAGPAYTPAPPPRQALPEQSLLRIAASGAAPAAPSRPPAPPGTAASSHWDQKPRDALLRIPPRERRPTPPPAFTDDLPTPHRRPPQPLGEHRPGLPCLLRKSIWPGTHSRCLCTRSPANPKAQRRPSPCQGPTRPQSAVPLPRVVCACRVGASRPSPRSNPPLKGLDWRLRRSAAAGAELRRPSAAAHAPSRSWPPDPYATAWIRSWIKPTRTLRSRSSGQKPRVPVRP